MNINFENALSYLDTGSTDLVPWSVVEDAFENKVSTDRTINGHNLGTDVVLYQAAEAYPDFTTAITALESAGSNVTLIISTPQSIDDDIVVPSNISLLFLNGGYITIPNSKTLTVEGSVDSGLFKIFNCVGTGSVEFYPNVLKEVYPEWFGITGTDDEIGIQLALNAVASNTSFEVYPTGSNDPLYGGSRVILQSKEYSIAATIEIPTHCQLVGAGAKNTLIVSDYNGQLIRSKYDVNFYDNESIVLKGFKIKGNRTKASQVGIDLLRCNNSILSDVTVSYCGSHGIIARQCLVSSFRDVDTYKNIGHGLYITDGVNSWADLTSTNLPSNSNTFEKLHAGWNDGAGFIINNSYGNIVLSGACESNYYSAGNNTGYNIIIQGTSKQNFIKSVWCEGAVQAHIYHNLTNASADTNVIDSLIHFGNGTSGNVDRAIICNCGNLIVINPINHGDSYKTINSSTAPFRVVKANVGKIFLYGGYSYGRGGGTTAPIEDENGNIANLANYATYDYVAAGGARNISGTTTYYNDAGEGTAGDYYKTSAPNSTTWDTYPWLRLLNNSHILALGDGTAAALQVLGTRKTGWTAATGTANRATFLTSTVTLEQLAQRVKALLDDLISHGLIGS